MKGTSSYRPRPSLVAVVMLFLIVSVVSSCVLLDELFDDIMSNSSTRVKTIQTNE